MLQSDGQTPLESAWVPRERLELVRREVERLSRRGRRLGTGPLELRERRLRDGGIDVELHGARPQLGGYRVVATLHHEGGKGTVDVVPGEAVDVGRWRVAEPWCEHCAVRRQRHVTYLLRQGAARPIQVGSSCLGDFTGAHDPLRAARQAEILGQARRALRGSTGEVGPAPADTALVETFLASVEVAGMVGFCSRRRAEGEVASADRAWNAAFHDAPGREALGEAAAVMRWVRDELAEETQRSEYEDRLVWALSRPRLSHAERNLVASAVQAHAQAKAPYVGEPGERVTIVVRVEATASDAVRGRWGDAYLHRLHDGVGRLVIWYATRRRLQRSAHYELRGTVRRCGSFGSEAATVMTRCRARILEAG
jgi:hypothetical protein